MNVCYVHNTSFNSKAYALEKLITVQEIKESLHQSWRSKVIDVAERSYNIDNRIIIIFTITHSVVPDYKEAPEETQKNKKHFFSCKHI